MGGISKKYFFDGHGQLRDCSKLDVSKADHEFLEQMAKSYPYLPEPILFLALIHKAKEESEKAKILALEAVRLFKLLGQPWYKIPGSGNVLKEVLQVALELSK